jgi:hypothetical protein
MGQAKDRPRRPVTCEGSPPLTVARDGTGLYRASALLVVAVGAFVAQIAILRQDWIHPIVIGASS